MRNEELSIAFFISAIIQTASIIPNFISLPHYCKQVLNKSAASAKIQVFFIKRSCPPSFRANFRLLGAKNIARARILCTKVKYRCAHATPRPRQVFRRLIKHYRRTSCPRDVLSHALPYFLRKVRRSRGENRPLPQNSSRADSYLSPHECPRVKHHGGT